MKKDNLAIAKVASMQKRLNDELERLKQELGIGHEVRVEWSPSVARYHNERRLLEEVKGNTIFIYSKNHDEVLDLLRHGFAEWLLNQHARPYLQLINNLITISEQLQYERKERIIEALIKLMAQPE